MLFYIEARKAKNFLGQSYNSIEAAKRRAIVLSEDNWEVSVFHTEGDKDNLVALFVRGKERITS